MNPRSEWFKRNTQCESIRRIPTSQSWGLKDWSGFIRIQSLGLTRIETDWFLIELHQTRLKTFFRLTQMSSDWRGNRFRNKSDWFGMNVNPKLLPGNSSQHWLIATSERDAVFSGTTLVSALKYVTSVLTPRIRKNLRPSVPARVFGSFPVPSVNAVQCS